MGPTEQKIVMGLIFGLIVRWFTPIPVTWKGGIVVAGKSTLLCNKWQFLNLLQASLGIGVTL